MYNNIPSDTSKTTWCECQWKMDVRKTIQNSQLSEGSERALRIL